ncbi:hypothetical protein AUH73_06600 [archaeon 13_1_40CM_4_53_4]|nr:MAG: hypothetical protein AUH73_06600 [archaeon 13_1_40CM_4_53_4]
MQNWSIVIPSASVFIWIALSRILSETVTLAWSTLISNRRLPKVHPKSPRPTKIPYLGIVICNLHYCFLGLPTNSRKIPRICLK